MAELQNGTDSVKVAFMKGKWFLGLVGIGVAVGTLSFFVFRFVFDDAVDSSLRAAISGALGGVLGGFWLRKQKRQGSQG